MSRPRIEIVGLGPAGVDYVTDHTRQRIAAHRHRFLRTARHPSAAVVPDAIALDHRYEIADTFDETYRAIVEDLVAAAHEHGEILYAVPGSPLILERTVRDLLVDDRVECVVQPAMSFLDLVWPALGIDPVEATVTLVDGHDFATAAAGADGPLLVAHCHADWILSTIKLSTEDTDDLTNDDAEVILLHHLGLPDQVVTTVPWSEMDRTLEADHLTSLYIPRLRVPVGRELVAFHELARRLRRECPWDREQTHRSLTRYLLEETYEVVDALDALDPGDPRTDEHLLEELGDLLYQIEFHAAIAEQEGRFTMADVARGINDKLVRRHPHVFGTSGVTDDMASLTESWDAIKKAEKESRGIPSGPFDGLPRSSGSLSYAEALVKRAGRAGIEVEPDPSGCDLAAIADLGALLFEIVVECRHRGIDPEEALRTTTNTHRRAAESHDAP